MKMIKKNFTCIYTILLKFEIYFLGFPWEIVSGLFQVNIYIFSIKDCNILKIILVQGFCPLKVWIARFPIRFRLKVYKNGTFIFTCLPCDEVKFLPTVSYLSSLFSRYRESLVKRSSPSAENLTSFFFFRNSRPLLLLGLHKSWLLISDRKESLGSDKVNWRANLAFYVTCVRSRGTLHSEWVLNKLSCEIKSDVCREAAVFEQIMDSIRVALFGSNSGG